MKKTTKISVMFSILLATLISASLLIPREIKAAAASDTEVDSTFWGGKQSDVTSAIGISKDKDPRETAANVINIILGLLGIVAVVLVLIAGFKWMTAMGNEDKITEAKGLLEAAVIGLVIILSAYALSQFVLKEIYGATKS